MNKKIMILGAGPGQLHLAKTCKKFGAHLVVFAPQRQNSPCFEIADTICYGDVRDKEAVYEAAKNCGVVAIFTDQLDLAVPACGYASEKLGLVGNSYACSLKFSDKQEMHRCAQELGVNVAQSYTVSGLDAALKYAVELGFPVIIKPSDSDASRGVYKIASESELRKYFVESLKYSSNNLVIVQEFIEGDEYVVEGLMRAGTYTTCMVGSSENFCLPDKCISKQRIFKSAACQLTPLEEELVKTNLIVANGFAPNLATTHGEYIYCRKNGKIYLNEIAARGGGCSISSHILPMSSGVDANEVLVKSVLFPDENLDIQLKKGYAAYTSFLLPEGEICDIQGEDEINKITSLDTFFLSDVKVGTKTPAIKDKSSRFGPFILSSTDLQTLLSDIELLKLTYKVIVRNQDEILESMIW